MKNRSGSGRGACALLSVAVVAWAAWCVRTEADDDGPQPAPVDNMHHFMEYVFEPAYKRLKTSLADAPADRAAWKAVKGDSLTLAEGCNLLLLRAPDEAGDKWRSLAGATRTRAAQLYNAARESDYETARGSYVGMLKACNTCHKQFADGKHQLQP